MLHLPWRHAFPCRAHGGGLDTGRKAYFGRQASGAVARMTPVPSGPPARAGKAISEAGGRGEEWRGAPRPSRAWQQGPHGRCSQHFLCRPRHCPTTGPLVPGALSLAEHTP